MSKKVHPGIETNPVVFANGFALPHNPSGDLTDPQNIWFSIEQQQGWAGARILGQADGNIQIGEPYIEPVQFEDLTSKITVADEQRHGTDRYTARRNADSLVAFLGLHRKAFFAELAKKNVLDVGSGDGHTAEDLRHFAKARVTELDFSYAALKAAGPITANRGNRVIGDGTLLPFSNATFDGVVSMFSTSVHSETVRSRLSGLTEAIRVTKPGGKVFMTPLIGDSVNRHERWALLENTKQACVLLGISEDEVEEYKQIERQRSAMDFAVHGLLRELMATDTISFTPILKFDINGGIKRDVISAIIEVNQQLTADRAADLTEELASPFTKK